MIYLTVCTQGIRQNGLFLLELTVEALQRVDEEEFIVSLGNYRLTNNELLSVRMVQAQVMLKLDGVCSGIMK